VIADRPLVVLLAGLATIALASAVAFWMVGTPGAATMSGEQWQAWQSASPSERKTLVELFEELQGDDGRAAMTDARHFAATPAATQQRYREIHVALAAVLKSLPPTQRRAVLNLPPAGRAAQLYRIMESQFASELHRLRGSGGGAN
jgi:hypothetical protein